MTNNKQYPFEIMAKPCGPLCNLDCVYCFYNYKQNGCDLSYNWKMDNDILEVFILLEDNLNFS